MTETPTPSGDDGPAGPEGVPPDVFHGAYEGQAPWDTGRPQPEVLSLLDRGAFTGEVLDIGCGSGENALAIAAAGLRVTAFDMVPRAVELARDKALRRGIERIELLTKNALELDFEARFDSALDAGVFHVFSNDGRLVYREVVHRALRPGAGLHVLVFSEHQGGGGPRRVTQAELRECFADPWWAVEEIAEGRYDTRSGPKQAWRLHARRL